MQTTVNIIGWHDKGVILQEPKLLAQSFNLELPIDKLRNLLGMWRILNKPRDAKLDEDNQLIFLPNL